MLIIPLVILGGLLVGWFASIVLKTRYYHGVVLNLIVGLLSALISGYLFAPVLRRPSILSGIFSMDTLMISLAGAAIMLLIVDLIRRAGTR